MGPQGYVRWQLEGNPIFEIPAKAVVDPPQNAAGTNPKRLMIEEPLYLIFNTALSTSWGTTPPNPGQPCRGNGADARVNKVCDAFPLYLKIDYIRVWQSSSGMSVGCDPASHPTAQYITEYVSNCPFSRLLPDFPYFTDLPFVGNLHVHVPVFSCIFLYCPVFAWF